MKDVEFRAWHRKEECWHYFDFVNLVIGDARHDSLQYEDWGRWTGRYDNKKQKIYEGDLTKDGVVIWCNDLTWESGGSPHPGFFLDGVYQWDSDEIGEMNFSGGFRGDIEILGNIRETPELYKKIKTEIAEDKRLQEEVDNELAKKD